MGCCEKPGIFGTASSPIRAEARKTFTARNEMEKICDKVAETGKIERQQLLDLLALERISSSGETFGKFSLPPEFKPTFILSSGKIIATVKDEQFEFSRNEIGERRKELGKKLGIYS